MGPQIKQILLVDDDPDDLELYVDIFKAIDPSIVTVRCLDPLEAISHLRRSNRLPDQIILDFNMPGMTGLDFLKLVRADDKLGRLRVAVVTTGCGPKDTQALLSLGAECHQKPSRYEEFKAILQQILNRSRLSQDN
jgi:CheY-like chemotaxis protein